MVFAEIAEFDMVGKAFRLGKHSRLAGFAVGRIGRVSQAGKIGNHGRLT